MKKNIKKTSSTLLFTLAISCSGAKSSEPELPLTPTTPKSIIKNESSSERKRRVSFPPLDHSFCKTIDRERRTPEIKHAERIRKIQFSREKERERQANISRGISLTEKANAEWNISSTTACPFNPLEFFTTSIPMTTELILEPRDEEKLTALSSVREIPHKPGSPLTPEEQETKVRNQRNADRVVSFIKIAEMNLELLAKNIEVLVNNLIDYERNEMELFINFIVSAFIDKEIFDNSYKQMDFEEKLQALSKEGVFYPDNFQWLVQKYLDDCDYDLSTTPRPHSTE